MTLKDQKKKNGNPNKKKNQNPIQSESFARKPPSKLLAQRRDVASIKPLNRFYNTFFIIIRTIAAARFSTRAFFLHSTKIKVVLFRSITLFTRARALDTSLA